jgi:hypothetical protein
VLYVELSTTRPNNQMRATEKICRLKEFCSATGMHGSFLAVICATIPPAHPRCPFVAILRDDDDRGTEVRLKVWQPRSDWATANLSIGDIVLLSGCTIQQANASPRPTVPNRSWISQTDASPALVLGRHATIRRLASTSGLIAGSAGASDVVSRRRDALLAWARGCVLACSRTRERMSQREQS